MEIFVSTYMVYDILLNAFVYICRQAFYNRLEARTLDCIHQTDHVNELVDFLVPEPM